MVEVCFLLLGCIFKAIITKVCMLGIILLFFYVKGILIQKSEEKWNEYFISLNIDFVNYLIVILYLISSCIGAFFVYLLLSYVQIEFALYYTILLFIVTSMYSLIRFHRKGKIYINDKLSSLKQELKGQD